MEKLRKTLEGINPLHSTVMEETKAYLDSLTKPLGSLGWLEDTAVQLAGITGKMRNKFRKPVVIIGAADNGVVEEGVSSCPQEVTATVTANFTKGFTGINVFSRFAGCEIVVVDVGVKAPLPQEGILQRKIRWGTDNFTKGPALTREEAIRAVETGISVAEEEVRKGADIIGTGEMGIGNTTTSAAVLAVLSGKPASLVAGRGAGLSDEAMQNKIKVIEKGIAVNRPDPRDPLDVLAKVGGLDLAFLAGVFLGGAYCRVPVVIDGFIAGVAALAAVRLCEKVRGYCLPSHSSAEAGARILLEELKMRPPLDMGLRLGEGTGAALVFPLLELIYRVMTEMGTFAQAGIEQYVPQN